MPHRVLLMISSLRGGGSEQQTLLLLKHLDRSRFEPHLFVTEQTGNLLKEVPGDVPIHSFDRAPQASGIYVPGRALRLQTRHLVETIRQQAIDLIYDRTFHMTMIAGPAGRLTGVPRVSTIVSPPDRALPLVESKFVLLKRLRLAAAYRQSHQVVAVSRIAADAAKRFYWLNKGSVRVVHNAVDVAALHEASKSSIPQRDERLTLVCVGRMTEEKGHRDLLSAIDFWATRSKRSLRLWLIGDGPLRNELQSQCEQANIAQCVDFLGRQPTAAPFIAAADALVLPSHFEGMPNVVLEAMALGTPVIATRAGGTIELQRDEPTILWADPGDPRSLAEAIDQFVLEREGNLNRAAAASRMVRDHHDVRTMTADIEAILARAAEG